MTYKHKFAKPFEYDGKKYDEIAFDFDKLTGNDMIAIERELAAEGDAFVIPSFSSAFKIKMAAHASGIGDDVLRAVPAPDFNVICGEAHAFLRNGE